MKAVVVVCVVSIFVAWSHPTFAEPELQAGKHAGAGEAGDGDHKEADQTKLKDRELSKLGEYSGVDEGALGDIYNYSLPAAITAAIKDKDYTELSVEANRFAGYLNEEDLKFMRDDTLKEIESENSKDKKADDRFIMLMKSLNWVAKLRLGDKPGTADEEKFAKIAQGDMEKVDAGKAANRDKIALAADGDKKSKDELLEKFNRKALMSYLNRQMKSGNKTEADNAAKVALAISKDEKGKNFIDGIKDGKGIRYWVGQDKEGVQDFFKKADEKQILGGIAVSQKKIANPGADWSVKDGALAKAPPAGIEPRKSSPFKLVSSKKTVADGPSGDGGGGGGGAAEAKADFNALKTLVNSSRCQQCHDSVLEGTNAKDARIKKDSNTPVSVGTMIGKLNQMKLQNDPSVTSILNKAKAHQ